MVPPSEVPPEKLEAYRQALYRVEALEGPFLLKVDEPSPELTSLLALHGATQAAYLTACNPLGRRASDKDNHRWQQELEADLNPWVILPGSGEDPRGEWDPEPSFLALGIPPEKAKELGKKYRQLAILLAGEDAIPRLVWSGRGSS